MGKSVNRFSVALVLALLAFWSWALADSNCYEASQASGDLVFEATLDGRSFEGQFEAFDVQLCMSDQTLLGATIHVSVDTGSANTRSRDRDQTLKGESFFWVDAFPAAVWTSGPWHSIDGAFELQSKGELTLRDITQQQPVSLSLVEIDDDKILRGEARIQRLDYNVGIGEFEDTDFIGNEVKLMFELKLKPVS